MKSKFLGFYNYTVVLTYIGMLIGFLGIVCTMEGDSRAGLICLMAAGVCDMFDGAVASTKKDRTCDEKCFGIQIDSLSDLICFGVLPAVIICQTNKGNNIAYAIAALYVLAALIRLSYFNVDEQNRQKECGGKREIYYGLPVTSIAVILPFLFGIYGFFNIKRSLSSAIALLICGILFLTPFQLKKPAIIGKITLAVCGAVELIFLIAGLGDV